MVELQQQIIERYTEVLSRGVTMLSHATRGEWNELLAIQSRYVDEVEQLAEVEKGVEITGKRREEKRRLLIDIRDTEDAVRRLLDQRMQQLSSNMVQARAQREVYQAYGMG